MHRGIPISPPHGPVDPVGAPAELRRPSMDSQTLHNAEQALGHVFSDKALLLRALKHASQADSRVESNERLEFLGDSVLGLVICDYLYQIYPNSLEGELTKIKSNIVSRRTCAELATDLGLVDFLQLGKGMGARKELPQSLAAAVFESLIGALYLDAGLQVAREFILRQMRPLIDEVARLGHQDNFKSVLQQSLQRFGHTNPVYLVVNESGPDHAKNFQVCVQIGDRRFAACWGNSKKEAEQQSALDALLVLGLARKDEDGDIGILDEKDIDQSHLGRLLESESASD